MLFGLFKKKVSSKDTIIDESSNIGMQKETKYNSKSSVFVSIATNPGGIRDVNEDNFFVSNVGSKPCPIFSCETIINENNLCFFAVFDGMGGEAFGEEASNIASATLEELASDYDDNRTEVFDINEIIKQFISLANNRICDMIVQKKCNRSGCTMALIVLWNEMAYAFSIGDSRIYRCQESLLEQISEDQTLAIKKMKANIYTEDEARSSPDANKITSYLGLDNRGVGVPYHVYEPFTFSEYILLLCSDGLSDMCTTDEIQNILASNNETPAKSLVELALKNGGEDNITCIVIKTDI